MGIDAARWCVLEFRRLIEAVSDAHYAMKSSDLNDRRALVVGAGSQLGRAIALALGEAGADVAVATLTTDAEEAFAIKRTSRRLAELGRRSPQQSIDASNPTAVQVMMRQVTKELGGLHILVNCHDRYLEKTVAQTSDADWSQTLAVNLSAVFYACRSAIRELSRGSGGSIINVTSLLGLRGQSGTAAYAAAKGGVIQLTRALAQECAGQEIRVNAIALGVLEGQDGYAAGMAVPLRRLAQPEDVTALAVYLASNAAAYVTGQVFCVDGGLSSRLG